MKDRGAETVKQTWEVTKNITKEGVRQLNKQGVTKKWVQDQLSKYLSSAAKGGAKLRNAQMEARTELMKKILENWPW